MGMETTDIVFVSMPVESYIKADVFSATGGQGDIFRMILQTGRRYVKIRQEERKLPITGKRAVPLLSVATCQ